MSHEATPLPEQVEEMIGHCRDAMIQAKGKGDISGTMRASKELRALFELKHRLQAEQQNRRAGPDNRQQDASDIQNWSQDELNRRIQILTLTPQIKARCRRFGEPETIAEPANLQYLEERNLSWSFASSSADCGNCPVV